LLHGLLYNTATAGVRSGSSVITSDSIDFFLNNNITLNKNTSHLPVWQSPLITFSAEQELSIPMPDQAGKWKLEIRSFV